MYFINHEHESNYIELASMYKTRFKEGKIDFQYLPNIYIASTPGLFELINLYQLDLSSGPLFHLMSWNDEEEKHEPSHPGLTGSTKRLVEIGSSLYNGYPADLDYTFSEEFANVIIQAIKIRSKLL